jgi:glycosyltransferase involved in cell wall biosynthesis
VASKIGISKGPGPASETLLPEGSASVTTVKANGASRAEVPRGNTSVGHATSIVDLPFRGRRPSREVSVAVLLPCKNEVLTIGKVVNDFQTALPGACVYVYDNASTDGTAEEAARAGAIVRFVPEPGKGNVIRRMFAEVEADVYVVADGDDTYDASRSPELVGLVTSRSLDMVVGSRVAEADQTGAYPRGHRLGNSLFNTSVRMLFGDRPADMLTGYRAFSRRFVKSFPCTSRGFEVETELTLHAMDLRVPVVEVATSYKERSEDSASKLRTLKDGFKILGCLLSLFHSYRPLKFYGAFACIWLLAAGTCAAIGEVGFHPWTGLSGVVVCLLGLAAVFALLGLSLASVRRGQREVKRMIYLSGRTSMADAAFADSVGESMRSEHDLANQADVARGQPGGGEVHLDLVAPRSAELSS